jgi:hypothetical protein
MPDKATDVKAKSIAVKLGLKKFGQAAFLELCQEGCDPDYLAEHLPFINKKTKVKTGTEQGVRGEYVVNLRSLDSYESAVAGLEKRDLEKLPKQLLELAELIEKINLTMLVRYMNDDEFDTDIFKLPKLLVYYSKAFIPLLLEKYESSGERKRPQYNEYLNRIIDHVEQSTGEPNYKLICDVLNDIGINESEGSLSQWRYRNRDTPAKTTITRKRKDL